MTLAKHRYSVIYQSDAHLFFAGYGEKRTRETLMNLWHACEAHDLVVLNGDIFELPFSRPGFSKTVARAISVLEYTLARFPDTQINYTIGNHDADPVFVYELQKLAQRYPNFQVTEKHLMLDGWVSTHGDLPDEGKDTHKVPFYTFFKGVSIPAQFTLNKLQGSIPKRIQEKEDRSVHRRIPLDSWAEKISQYFADSEPELYARAEVFVLGHTHRHGEQIQDGKKFLNTGVMFDHDQYAPVEREISKQAYREYCGRVKPTPDLPKRYADERALKAVDKIEKRLAEGAEGLAQIIEKPGHFVDDVQRISALYEKDGKAAAR